MASHWFTKEGCKCLCRQHSTQYQLHQSSSMMDAALRTEKGDDSSKYGDHGDGRSSPPRPQLLIQHCRSWTVTKT